MQYKIIVFPILVVLPYTRDAILVVSPYTRDAILVVYHTLGMPYLSFTIH